MKTKLQEWPEGTQDYVNHRILKDYIQSLAKNTGVEESTIFGAKVTTVKKEGKTWTLVYETLRKRVLAGESYVLAHKLVRLNHRPKDEI